MTPVILPSFILDNFFVYIEKCVCVYMWAHMRVCCAWIDARREVSWNNTQRWLGQLRDFFINTETCINLLWYVKSSLHSWDKLHLNVMHYLFACILEFYLLVFYWGFWPSYSWEIMVLSFLSWNISFLGAGNTLFIFYFYFFRSVSFLFLIFN